MSDDYPIVEEFPPREPEPMPKPETKIDALTIVCGVLIALGLVWGAEISWEFWLGGVS